MPCNKSDSVVLTLNSGSSSLKFSLFHADGDAPVRGLHGKIERIGAAGTSLSYDDPNGDCRKKASVGQMDHAVAGRYLCDWLARRPEAAHLAAIGHRVVHGGPRYHEPGRVTPALLDELRRIRPYAPEHLPAGIELMELFAARMPRVPQVACFDTAFHRGMPQVAKLLPLPRRFQAEGVERYGFHGLSYAYLMQELPRIVGENVARGRVVLAHLGNGASLCAVRDGRSIDTSMGFTPAAGVPMSTRSGDIDPGLVCYLQQTRHLDADAFHRMVNHESGLIGVSETSADMRDLLDGEAADPRAAEAVELFCYQVKKWIGAFAAALGGLDVLVFAGGIGENAPPVRERVCRNMEYLGLTLDPLRNAAGETVISAQGSGVKVCVIPTDEDVMIARSAFAVIGAGKP